MKELTTKRQKRRMRRWRETVEVCLGVTGLRGAFSHRVVSEACRVSTLLGLTLFILRTRAADTYTHTEQSQKRKSIIISNINNTATIFRNRP